MRLRISTNGEDQTKVFEFGETKITGRKVTIEDRALLELEASTDGLLDKRLMRCLTWRHILAPGWEHLEDAGGNEIPFDVDAAAYVHEDSGELRGVGPGLPANVGEGIWAWAHQGVYEHEKVLGNSAGSPPDASDGEATPGSGSSAERD